MASVYKLKRKNTKIQDKTELNQKENLTPDLFPEKKDAPASFEDELFAPKPTSAKLEEIYTTTGGMVGEASKEEYDKTASLLKDVYSDNRSSVKKQVDLFEGTPAKIGEEAFADTSNMNETSYGADFIASLEKISIKAEEIQNQAAEAAAETEETVDKKDEEVIEISDEKEEVSEPVLQAEETPKEDAVDSQSLLDALTVQKVDSDKLEEVFNAANGTIGVDASKEEFDETTDLLREIFGNERAAAKAKQAAEAESEAVPAEPAEAVAETVEEAATEEKAEEEYIADHGGEADKTIDYIAIHDGEGEKTIEYSSLAGLSPDQVDPSVIAPAAVPPLADELQVSKESLVDDPYNSTYEDAETNFDRKHVLPDEFTSPDQYDEFSEHLRNKNYRNLSALLWTFLAFLAGLYIESATFSKIYHPEFLKPGGDYNAIYLLADMQFIFISALLSLPSLINGVKSLFKGKPDRNTVMFILYLFTALHTVILLSCGAKEYPLFGCVASLFAFLNSFANLLDAKRVYRTFRICGSKGDKIVAKPLASDSPEAEVFRNELEGEPQFFSIQKAKFIDRFFARSNEQAKIERSFAWVTAISLFISVGFAALSYFRDPDIANTASNFMTMMVMTLPLSCVFSISLPFAHIAAKSEKLGSAIVSLSASEEYAAADVVSFTDREIFPPKSVKITTIRTYGQTRIDKAILYSAMIFQKLGGPLSEVFKKTISGVVAEISEDFEFKEITADGMCAFIEGQDIFVGNKNYLLSYDFGYTRDEQDKDFEAKQGKIMYMVIGNELAAKFYLRYSISKQFKKTVLSLFRSGICPAVKTCDPNFDSALFRALLQNKKIPAAIIKSCEAMKDAPAVERSDSGIVCVSSIAKLLRTFSFCESLRKVTHTNVAIKILSALAGIAIVLFLFFVGGLTKITTIFVLIYQLLWLIPVIFPSLFE